MWLHTSCRLAFRIEVPTPFVLMLRPRSGAQQWIASEEYLLEPFVPVFEFTDDYGNLCQRLVAPPGDFSLSTAARVMTADRIDEHPGGYFVEIPALPDSVLRFLLPSRYCEADRFGAMAADIVADRAPGYDQVAAIEDWLRRSFHFRPGSSSASLSALEASRQPEAVCRDLAHLGISLCRALGDRKSVV